MAIDWTAIQKKAKRQDAAYNAKATQGAENRATYQAIAKNKATAAQVQSGATSSLPSISLPSATSSANFRLAIQSVVTNLTKVFAIIMFNTKYLTLVTKSIP